ncbi:MAG TPA: PKD domain-containing protein, partial [Bacteroidia bacterium]|nr:PKD domain-containing protein [Bacteroidia bacterium]
NPSTSALQNPTGIIFSTSGLQNISITVTDPGCGVSTANQTVMVFAPPIASATATPSLATLENAHIQFTNTTTGAISSVWDFGDNYQSTITNPNHTYTATGNYTVTLVVVDANGCMDTTTLTVVVDDQSTFYIPNAFSPNGDGLNDFFTGTGTGITDFHMMVWDRWGMLIFESYDITKPWDGTFRGKKVEEDVYVYHIDVTNLQGESDYYTGHVSVIR